MSGKAPPAFQFYPDDFLGGTMHMSDAEVGYYVRLLCVQWNAGEAGLTDDKEELARYSKGGLVEPALNRVLTKFQRCSDGRLRNSRLESERVKQIEYREHQKRAGRASAEARLQRRLNDGCNAGSTTVQPSPQPKANSPSPSPNSSTVLREREKGGSDFAAKVAAGRIQFGAITSRIKSLEAKRDGKGLSEDERQELKKLRRDLADLQKKHAAGDFGEGTP